MEQIGNPKKIIFTISFFGIDKPCARGTFEPNLRAYRAGKEKGSKGGQDGDGHL